ncbi:MAG: two-component system response regulator [Phenylobacterium sp.]|uniref:response regulator n=1 Tax=Phenylobacterium sp. TaxID=1871053 RepID=UPI00391B5DDB
MYTDDAKLIQKMRPLLQRVLVIDPHPASARLLADLMRTMIGSQVWIAPSGRKALTMIHEVDAQIIFVEMSGHDTDGIEFTRRLRRSDAVCRQAPVVMMTAEATAQAIRAARDVGVHEFMRKPFTTKDLMRRLEAVTLRPRDWIEAVEYIGPDRRRFNSGDYKGPLKRKSDARQTPDAARISQALKILKSAVAAVASDPTQALRAMLAQAADLQKAALAVNDLKLATATADLQRYLTAVVDKSAPFTVEEAGKRIAPLLVFLPADAQAKPAAPGRPKPAAA